MPPVPKDLSSHADSIERDVVAIEARAQELEAEAKALGETLSTERRRPARRAWVFLAAASTLFVLGSAAAIVREKVGRPDAMCAGFAVTPAIPPTSGFELEQIRFDGKLASGPPGIGSKGSRCTITVTVRRGLALPITEVDAVVFECGRKPVHTWFRDTDLQRGARNDMRIEIASAPPSGIPGEGERFDLTLNERWGTPDRALVSVIASTATGHGSVSSILPGPDGVKTNGRPAEWEIVELERGYATDRSPAP